MPSTGVVGPSPQGLAEHIKQHEHRLVSRTYDGSVHAASDRADEIRGLLRVMAEVRETWARERKLLDDYRLWRMKAEEDLADLQKRLADAEFTFACAVAEHGLLTIDEGTMVRLPKNTVIVRTERPGRVEFTVGAAVPRGW